eukprot:jgi/Chrzof1/7160/Cz02g13100.t1
MTMFSLQRCFEEHPNPVHGKLREHVKRHVHPILSKTQMANADDRANYCMTRDWVRGTVLDLRICTNRSDLFRGCCSVDVVNRSGQLFKTRYAIRGLSTARPPPF